MQEEDFPSELELDVIVGTRSDPSLANFSGVLRGDVRGHAPLSLLLIFSKRALLRGPCAKLIPTES
jgi:hypothetical protein